VSFSKTEAVGMGGDSQNLSQCSSLIFRRISIWPEGFASVNAHP